MRLSLALRVCTEAPLARLAFAALLTAVALAPSVHAQNSSSPPQKTQPVPAAQPAPRPPLPADEYTGMYSFVNEGDYVQLAVVTEEPLPNNGGYRVTGYVSRLGDDPPDKGMVLDHLITRGTLKGDAIDFTTRAIHGISFSFVGKVRRGTAKGRKEDGYYEIAGELTRTQTVSTGGEKKTASRSRNLIMKLFGEIDDVEENDDKSRP